MWWKWAKNVCKKVEMGETGRTFKNARSPMHQNQLPNNNDAQSTTKYGFLLRPDAQIVALHAQCARGAPKRGQNQKWLPHPCLLAGPKEGKNVTSPLHSRVSPYKRGQNQKWLPHRCLLRGPQMGRNATKPLPSQGSPNKGVQNQKWPPHPYLLGGPKGRGNATSPLHSWGSPNKGEQNQKWGCM